MCGEECAKSEADLGKSRELRRQEGKRRRMKKERERERTQKLKREESNVSHQQETSTDDSRGFPSASCKMYGNTVVF